MSTTKMSFDCRRCRQGSRTTAARAKTLLARLGTPGHLRDDDRLDAADEP